MRLDKSNYHLLIFVSAVLLFIPFLGVVHLFDWDEINFAESAREMLLTGNYGRVQINFEPFWEKPPLFFWMQCISMKLFGINEFASRFPNAICGVITLLTFYFLGKRHKNEKFGFVWALCYLGSFLPHFYFKSGIIDPWFNYFIFISIWLIHQSFGQKEKSVKFRYVLLGGIASGLAVLIKGPVALLIVTMTVVAFYLMTKRKTGVELKYIFTFLISAFAISFLWFGFELFKNGPWFLKEFVLYQIDLFLHPVAGHQEPIYYHFLVVFIGCFPLSIFALPKIYNKSSDHHDEMTRWMKTLFWVVMILFTIVKTKIVHYSSLSYFPLSFLAATYLYELLDFRVKFNKVLFILFIFIGTIFSLIFIALPLLANHKEFIIPFIKDPFAIDCLNANVTWSGWEPLIGVLYFSLIIYVIISFKKTPSLSRLMTMFYANALFIFFYLIAVVPKIEAYSQGPAISFYQSMRGAEAYVYPYGFKSYAQYFYFQKPDHGNANATNMQWLLHGAIDRDVYLVAKSTAKNELDTIRELSFLKKDGGFLFYMRLKPDTTKP